MRPLLLALPGSEAPGGRLAAAVDAEVGGLEVHRFPDGECLPRIHGACADRDVVLFASLHQPDDKLLPLAFTADAARDLGARRVLLVAPYLPYMRQDRRFRPGEAITSKTYSRILSSLVDGLVTVDPHLHRYPDLAAIYGVPARVQHAAPAIAAWVREHVAGALIVGPDEESAQWAAEVGALAGAPHVVLTKLRRGDRDVEVSVPEIERWRGATPVLVDDIISTARTMCATVGQLRRAGLAPPVCVGVHAVFAGDAWRELREAGAADVVTTDAIPHPTNRIPIHGLLADGVRSLTGR